MHSTRSAEGTVRKARPYAKKRRVNAEEKEERDSVADVAQRRFLARDSPKYDITTLRARHRSRHGTGRTATRSTPPHTTGTWGVIAAEGVTPRPATPFPPTACCAVPCISHALRRDGVARSRMSPVNQGELSTGSKKSKLESNFKEKEIGPIIEKRQRMTEERDRSSCLDGL